MHHLPLLIHLLLHRAFHQTVRLHLTAVRLIRSAALRMASTLECWRSLQLVALLTKGGAANALVRVRRLLNNHLLVPALARATAYTKQPEESGGNAECDAEPHDLEHLVAHGGFDVVGLERSAEHASQDTVDGGGGGGSCDGEDRRGLKMINLNCRTNFAEKLTVERIVVTKLPHLEKMAKNPTTNSAAVKAVAMINAQFIHPAIFL